jgi:hypothetical protein
MGMSARLRSSVLSRSVALSAESRLWIVLRAVAQALVPCAMKAFSAGWSSHQRDRFLIELETPQPQDNIMMATNPYLIKARGVKSFEETLRRDHRQVQHLHRH